MLKTTLGIVQAVLILGKLFGSLDIVILLVAAVFGLAYLADRQRYRKILK